MYELIGEDKIFGWLSNEPDADKREALLDFLPVLATDPDSSLLHTSPVPALAFPVFLTQITGTDYGIEYLRNDTLRTLKFRDVYLLP